MVRGVVCLFFSVSAVCCQFYWWLNVCGRISVLYNLIYFGRIVVFLAVPYFFQAGNFLNSLQVDQAESEPGGPGTSA
jgi:hypothetical protein